MSPFQKQLEAIGTALLLIQKLPLNTLWSLTCTNDDDAESPSVLNIFIAEPEWSAMSTQLDLKKPTDRSTYETGDQFISFRRGTLLVSFIEGDTNV